MGLAIWGTIRNKEFEKLTDASWNERLAAVLLIGGIVFIGIFPFWLTRLIETDAQSIMSVFGK